MTNKIIERIEREVGITGLVALLAERLSPTDLQSVLLEVYRQRAERLEPAAVLSDYESNRFVRSATISPIKLLEWERSAYASLPPEFQAIELSPVAPLGTSSAVGMVDQNRVISTIRNAELMSDSTNVLALEGASQRRVLLKANPKSQEAVHLATSQRLIRAQQFNHPLAFPHFSAFALCSAGRDSGNLRFEFSTLVLHIGYYVRALRDFLGDAIGLRLALTDFGAIDRQSLLEAHVFTPIREAFGDVECVMDSERTGGRDYYVDLCFHLHARNASGDWLELADGGVVNWTQRLLSSAKERCVISGIGSERVVTAFDKG